MTSFGVPSHSPFNRVMIALSDLLTGEKKIIMEERHRGSTNDFVVTTTIRVVEGIQDD
jgi:hypothetical protein